MVEKTPEPEPKPGENEPGGVKGTDKEEGDAKQFSQADMDRTVQKALATFEKNQEGKHQEALKEAKSKAEETRLAEQGKFKELAEQKEAELQAIKASRAAQELRAGTIVALNDKGLGTLAKAFDGDFDTLDGRKAMVDAVAASVAETVEAQVKEKLGSKPPPPGGKEGDGGSRKEGGPRVFEYDKMTPKE